MQPTPTSTAQAAEQVVQAGDYPVAQHRLVHPGFAVEDRVQVVAREDHLARRIDIERFVRVPNRVGAQAEEQQDNSRDQKPAQAFDRLVLSHPFTSATSASAVTSPFP